ncbi:MAG: cytochrome c-type biogenesis protein CcmH [Gemmatimonadetes bacterium]|nr:cytochrome c-type biogenesis protein CcmH [Gemmatimonadota bacterium]
MTMNRRGFLGGLGRAAAAGAVVAGFAPRAGVGQAQEVLPGQGEAGTLRDPASAGRSRERVTDHDNDAMITGVEKRMQCTCGCTLDIYTCRTTDFTCTYSPALHKEVVALAQDGKTADEIVAAFVEKYGEKVLMAPKPEGFNIAGYVVPGVAILLVAGAMLVILRQRTRSLQLRTAAAVPGDAAPMAPGTLRAVTAAPPASSDELARLERELRELDS